MLPNRFNIIESGKLIGRRFVRILFDISIKISLTASSEITDFVISPEIEISFRNPRGVTQDLQPKEILVTEQQELLIIYFRESAPDIINLIVRVLNRVSILKDTNCFFSENLLRCVESRCADLILGEALSEIDSGQKSYLLSEVSRLLSYFNSQATFIDLLTKVCLDLESITHDNFSREVTIVTSDRKSYLELKYKMLSGTNLYLAFFLRALFTVASSAFEENFSYIGLIDIESYVINNLLSTPRRVFTSGILSQRSSIDFANLNRIIE
jgi:predicted transcriptional regulator